MTMTTNFLSKAKNNGTIVALELPKLVDVTEEVYTETELELSMFRSII